MGPFALHCGSAILGRRSFMRGAACAATAPALSLLAGPAKAANWRGLVGCVKPRANESSLVDMIRLLPLGIGVAPVYLNFAEGTREEFQASYAITRRKSLILPRYTATRSVSRERRPS